MRYIAIGAIAVAIAVGSTVVGGGGGPPPPPPGNANVWIDTNGGTCTRQSTAGAYVDAQACASFDAAYQAASCGDFVDIVAGSYSTQTIPYTSSKSCANHCRLAALYGDGSTSTFDLSACVTFQPAPSQTPSFANLVVSAPYVRLLNLTLDHPSPPTLPSSIEFGEDSVEDGTCSHYVGFEHDQIAENITGQTFFLHGGDYQFIRGGTFDQTSESGPSGQATSSVVSDCSSTNPHLPLTHFELNGAHIQNLIQNFNGQHLECIHWFGSPLDGATAVRNNIFFNCAQYDISWASGGAGNLIENNVFDVPCSHQLGNWEGGVCGANHGITFSCNGGEAAGSRGHMIIRFNSFDIVGVDNGVVNASQRDVTTPQFDVNGTQCVNPTYIYANVLNGTADCSGDTGKGVTFSYNFENFSACGTGTVGNITPANFYVNELTPDFSMKNGSPAIDSLSPATFSGYPSGEPAAVQGVPTTDINGVTRPAGGNLDAGAYER